MSQSNFPPPQDYSAESFGQPNYGQPMYQQPPPRRGNRFALFGCGGILALMALCCCCCVAAGVFFVRQPGFQVLMWGTYGGTLLRDWTIASDLTVCAGSQAADYTAELQTAGDYFVTFNMQDDVLEDGVNATGTFENVTGTWEAQFFLRDSDTEGFLGKCIERIEVINDPRGEGGSTNNNNNNAGGLGRPTPTPTQSGGNS